MKLQRLGAGTYDVERAPRVWPNRSTLLEILENEQTSEEKLLHMYTFL